MFCLIFPFSLGGNFQYLAFLVWLIIIVCGLFTLQTKLIHVHSVLPLLLLSPVPYWAAAHWAPNKIVHLYFLSFALCWTVPLSRILTIAETVNFSGNQYLSVQLSLYILSVFHWNDKQHSLRKEKKISTLQVLHT